jgi:hypothetical protein
MGPPKFFDASLPACHGLRTPADLHLLANIGCARIAFGRVKTLGVLTSPCRSCTSTSGDAAPPTAYRILCLRLVHLVRRVYDPDSAMDARLDTGGWLPLPRQGLSPCKRRQAFLGATTPGLRRGQKRERSGRFWPSLAAACSGRNGHHTPLWDTPSAPTPSNHPACLPAAPAPAIPVAGTPRVTRHTATPPTPAAGRTTPGTGSRTIPWTERLRRASRATTARLAPHPAPRERPPAPHTRPHVDSPAASKVVCSPGTLGRLPSVDQECHQPHLS